MSTKWVIGNVGGRNFIPSVCEADRTGILAVSDDERVSELCGSMAVAVRASQSGVILKMSGFTPY